MKEQLKLDNQLCFKYYVVSKEIIKKYKPLLKPLSLTYTAYITMLVLWEVQSINVKELGKRLTLDSGTLTPLLKKLEKDGFVQRNRSKDDERVVYISLTKKGFDLQEKAKDIPDKISESIFQNINVNSIDLEENIKTLDKVYQILKP